MSSEIPNPIEQNEVSKSFVIWKEFDSEDFAEEVDRLIDNLKKFNFKVTCQIISPDETNNGKALYYIYLQGVRSDQHKNLENCFKEFSDWKIEEDTENNNQV
jgi:hypothetical protein